VRTNMSSHRLLTGDFSISVGKGILDGSV